MASPPPWLRGPVPGVAAALQPAAHSLLEVREDVRRFTADLPHELLHERPGGAASIAFHLFHLAGALDRLYTYARGEELSPAQQADLARERQGVDPATGLEALLRRVEETADRALAQLRATPEAELAAERLVGRAKLPSTVLGLLAHGAEHSVRHAGQISTTAGILRGLRA